MTPAPDPDTLLRQGESLARQGDLAGAAAVLARVLQADPGNGAVHAPLTRVLAGLGDWPALHREYLRLLELSFTGPAADWERCSLDLLFGKFPSAWDAYETRLTTPGLLRRPPHPEPQPLWQGQPFPGQTLLLRWEQGFGDSLQFVRFAPRVKALGGRVLLECQAPLADLLATCPGVDGVIPEGQPLPPFDLQLPLLSLPRVFRTTLDTVPAEVPYLSVPDHVPHREGIDRILAATQGLVRIGLCWSGHPGHARDAERSLRPDLLRPLAALPGAVFHSFQMDPRTPMPWARVIPLAPVLQGGFGDTAHALTGMDLVITVDTALAHLAGALGLPTLLLVPWFPDWRWLLGRNDSPWYPTLRLYRQPEPGAWEPVIRQVLADLSA